MKKREEKGQTNNEQQDNTFDMDIRVGDRVSVRWDETDKRFNATVEAIHDMPWSFDVLYDEKVRGKPCMEMKVSMDRVVRFGSPSPTHPQRNSADGEDLYVVDDGDDEEEEELFRSFHSNEDEDDGMYWGEGTVESAAAAAAAITSGSGNKRKEINILKYLCSLREEEGEDGKEVDIKLSVCYIQTPLPILSHTPLRSLIPTVFICSLFIGSGHLPLILSPPFLFPLQTSYVSSCSCSHVTFTCSNRSNKLSNFTMPYHLIKSPRWLIRLDPQAEASWN